MFFIPNVPAKANQLPIMFIGARRDQSRGDKLSHMLNVKTTTVVLCCLFLLMADSVRAQQAFEAIPPSDASKYRFDLSRYFFSSPAAEKQERKAVYDVITQLEPLKGRVTKSATNLEKAFELQGKVQSLIYRHTIYLSLLYSTNTRDILSRDEQGKFAAEANKRLGFLSAEVRGLDDKTLARIIRQRPSLKRYLFAIEAYRRLQPFTLTPAESALLTTLNPYIQRWQAEFYNRVPPTSDWSINQDNLAFVLIRLVKVRNAIAQLRHHVNSPEEEYFSSYLSTEEVKSLFEKLAQQAEIHKRYERARVSYLKKVTGRDTIRFYSDFRGGIPHAASPRFKITEATEAIKNSVAPLGPEYQREIAALLDPSKGRLDIVPGPNRVPGGSTSGFPGSVKSVFYTAGFRGNFNDVIVLAHEAGHAAQFEMMAGKGVLPTYVNGSDFIKESFSYFNELLLVDYLYQHETDPKTRVFYLDQFFERAFQIYNQAWAAEFEQKLYEGVEQGKLTSAEDLNALMTRTGSRYSIWFGMDDDSKRDWINIPHYFRSPLYRVNYLYARLLALKYFEAYKRDPGSFAPRYLSLLRNGYDAPPDVLLKQFLGIDMRGDQLVSDVLAILNSRLPELEATYAR